MSSTSRFWLALATTTAALALANQATAQTIGCSTGGPGGAFPTSGTGGGSTFPAYPPFEFQTTLNVASIPAGSTQITGIVLHGLAHTYTGDIQIVLEDPSLTQYNLFYRVLVGCDFGGVDYTITSPGESVAAVCSGTSVPGGSFDQPFGTWVSGTNGVNNVALNAIPMLTGDWKLYFYDWAAIDIGSFTSWDICFGLPPPPPPPPPASICSAPLGGGGLLPLAGTGGGGVWPNALPPSPLVDTLAVTKPASATKIVDIKLNGLSHTFVGDLHFTLTDPSGVIHNLIHRPGSTNGSFGSGCDLSGDYVIYETYGNDLAGTCGADDYFQSFGDWPDSTNGIFNTPLEMIPAMTGNYTLTVYDWAAVDVGTLTSWEVCFDLPSGPTVYCTAGTSTNGCVPSISASAQPSASLATGCVVTIASLEGQKFGIFFYGIDNTMFSPTPWANGSNSFLCVKGPTQRTGTSNSGGTLAACDGVLTLDWNAYQTANPLSVGNPFSTGDKVYGQAWYRDPPAPKTTNLSDAIEMTMVP